MRIATIPVRLEPDRYVVIDREDWSLRSAESTAVLIARMPATGRRIVGDDGRFQVWGPAGGASG